MFQKDKFKKALLMARGNRTNESYSKDSGVSRTYISAYLNLKRNEPPTPEIIRRLAQASYNNVTYEELMIAAGFIESVSESQSGHDSNDIYSKTKSITRDIENLSPESKKELEKYIQLLKLKDTMDKSKGEMSSSLPPDVSQNK